MELEKLDQKTRNLKTMYGAQHPKADVDCICRDLREGEV